MKLLLAAPAGRRDEPWIDPFVQQMEDSLRELGHAVDTFRLPTILSPAAAMDYALALGLLDVGAEAHRLITLGWHCHLLRHPRKIAVIHQRDAVLGLLSSETKRGDADYAGAAIAYALRTARRVVVPDQPVGERIRAFAAVDSIVGGDHLTSRETAETWLD